MPEFGVTALDFDDCVTGEGVDPQVEALTAGTYAEFSPSGKGIRAFVLGSLGDNKDSPPRNPDDRFGFEIFTSKGFVTFTGNATDLTTLTGVEGTLAAPVATLETYCASRFTKMSRVASPYEGNGGQALGLTEEQIVNMLNALPNDLSYDDWVKVGMAVHHETKGDGFGLWDEWSSTSPKYTSTEYSTERWVSFGINLGAPYTMVSLVRYAQGLGVDPGVDIDTASPDEFEALPELAKPSAGHFGFYSLGDFAAQKTEITWLVKNFLPLATLGVLFGASGSGKSFLALDMCCSIARGVEWNGLRTAKSRILYVVAEGQRGFRQRVHAYAHQHAINPYNIDIVICSGGVPNLVDPVSVRKLMEDIKRFGPFALIVLDTFAQVTPGANENSGEDMGKALAHCRTIGQAADAMVLLIHHSGKDESKGEIGRASCRERV